MRIRRDLGAVALLAATWTMGGQAVANGLNASPTSGIIRVAPVASHGRPDPRATPAQPRKWVAKAGKPSRFGIVTAFHGEQDGSNPEAPLTLVNGELYGTTLYGGQHSYGTAFLLTKADRKKIIHSFGDGPNGSNPVTTLTELDGVFYGTTSLGGAHQQGTIFSLTRSGEYKVLYSFEEGDGRYPLSGLVALHGKLYGATAAGGDLSCNGGSGCGVIYSITPDGDYKVVVRLSDSIGWFVNSRFLVVNDVLYVTAPNGGAFGWGSVFTVTEKGKAKVLYSFRGGESGGAPDASLTIDDGVLYGTASQAGRYDSGVAFSLTLDGRQTVLHAFGGASLDGVRPDSSLIPFKGKLYGTTGSGGDYSFGTIYSLTKSGKETVEHSFGGFDGVAPGGLTVVGRQLYGTTFSGGSQDECNGYGCGLIFSFKP